MEISDPKDVAPRLDRQRSRLLGQTSALVARQVAKALEAMGAHRNQFAVLATLEAFGPTSQADVSRRTQIDRSDMVATMARLEAEGLVGRGVDPDDRRRNIVKLTDAGQARLEALSEALDAAQARAFAPLDAGETEQLLALLRRLRDHHLNARDGGT